VWTFGGFGVHIYSGYAEYGPMIYWLVVAAICAFIAYGRFVLKPFNRLDPGRLDQGHEV
jgi:hypothetical protein